MDHASFSTRHEHSQHFTLPLLAVRDYAVRLQQTLVYGEQNRACVEEAITRVYQTLGRRQPKIVWCDSPFHFSNLPWLLSVFMHRDNPAWRNQLLVKLKRDSKMRQPEIKKLWSLFDRLMSEADQIEPLGMPFNSELIRYLSRDVSPRLASSAERLLGEEGKLKVEKTFNEILFSFVQRLKETCEPLVQRLAVPQMKYAASVYAPPGKNWVDATPDAFSVGLSHSAAFTNSWAIWDLSWLAAYDCMRSFVDIDGQIYDDDLHNQLNDWMLLLKNGMNYLFLENFCFVGAYPTSFLLDEAGRCHNADGPAVEFADGQKVYYWHGARVPGAFIRNKRLMTPWMIDIQPNAEVRRVMIEIYGWDKYLRKSRAKKLHQDRFGTLWKKDFKRGEPLVAVDVLNSTPEPDGSIKRYLLRVPPNMKTARQSVAWTFDIEENDYDPEVET